MGWGTNEKVLEKREKEATKKREEQRQRQQKKEKQKWKDQVTEKKFESAQQKQQKRLQQLARKKQLKEIAERQEAQLERINRKNKGQNERKLTQAQILQRQQQRMMEQIERNTRNQQQDFPEQNVNRNLREYQVANTVEGALRILDAEQQRHPERRFKAAFEAFCEKRQPTLKIDYPKLKRSQRLQMMRKQFEKHPDNPYNNKNIVAYNFNPRKIEKQEEDQAEK